MNIEIVNYEDKYFDDFKSIGYEWLNEYDLYEPEDGVILNNPHGYILNLGGIILMALIGNKVIGTVSLIKRDNNEYEIAKFGVLKDYRGLGAGRKLMEAIIKQTNDNNIENIILYTNSKLKEAQVLYNHLGFTQLDAEVLYEEADIKMKLKIINT
jgi:GNAT superfamily N-acetyltransferase